MRALVQLAYVVRRLLLGVLRLRTTGVKVLVFNPAGDLLLIRNGYGDSGLFLLPGGGVSRRESPAAAAVREVREELGLELREVEPVWSYESTAEGKKDTIHLFRAVTDGQPVADGAEVVEARFFTLDALPDRVSPATLRRIAELNGSRPYDGRW
ncbi:MAG: NUDIX domain-containing protein [Sphingomonas sp.]|nr:NUDIX domain-containing protein [Sphingomonas sp.]